jgi:hypothetical protein
MKNIKEKLQLLNIIAKDLGLNGDTIYHAGEFIEHHEFELSFDFIITQLYEYDIEIDDLIYNLIVSIGIQLKLSPDKYEFMNELIRNDKKVPKPVAEAINTLIRSL